MITELNVKTVQEVLSLVNGVSYSMVPHWYNGTYRDLKMNLIVPKHRENHPAQPCLLFLCGGAYSVVDDAIWMPELMYFARRGYTVATINYRTSNQAIFPAQLIDAKAAVRFLKAHAKQFCIDPDRIAISGESAGGTLCSLVGVTGGMAEFEQGDFLEYDSRVAAVVDFYGPVDMIAASGKGAQGMPDWIIPAFLGMGYDEAAMHKASAIEYVGSDTPPFMILHGTEDPVVDIASQSDRMYEKLREAGVYVEYLRLQGEGHGADAFYQPEIKEHICKFLDKVLGEKA